MSKTAKLGGIMLTSILALQVLRIVVGFIPLSDNLTTWLFDFLMQVISLGVLPFLMYRAFISSKPTDFTRDIRLTTHIEPISYLLAIAIGFLGYIINMGASTISYVGLDLLGFTFIRGGGTIYSGPEVLILDIICTAMFPAFFEEVVNRGVLLAALDGEKNDAVKIIFMGFFFGAFHQNVAQFLPTTIIGIIIAYMAVKSQSIVPGMIVHFMNNFFITITSYSSQTGGGVGSVMEAFDNFVYSNILILGGAVALAIWLMVITLRYYAKINSKHREARDAFPEPEKEQARRKESLQQNIYGIYGYPVYYQSGSEAARQAVLSQTAATPSDSKAKKVDLKDHIFLITAFVAAMVVTVFTYIWGVLR